jgi:hypothetical protein
MDISAGKSEAAGYEMLMSSRMCLHTVSTNARAGSGTPCELSAAGVVGGCQGCGGLLPGKSDFYIFWRARMSANAY